MADEVTDIRIHDRCRCEVDYCATIYTRPKPAGAWGGGLRDIVLELIVDVVGGDIACIEVLDRDEIREAMLAQVPWCAGHGKG